MHSADSLPAVRVWSSAVPAAVHPTDPVPALRRWRWPDSVHPTLLHFVPALRSFAVWYCHAAVVRLHPMHPEPMHSADSLPAMRERASAMSAAVHPTDPVPALWRRWRPDPVHPALLHSVPALCGLAVWECHAAVVRVHSMHPESVHPEPMHSADSLPALRVGSSALPATMHPTDPVPALRRWWRPDPVHPALLHSVPALCGFAVW